jgi:tRNA pseudouridine55 synthase
MGIYIVDKPLGLTSFDVVAKARKALATKRVGHTGTLDPLATGVLIIASEDSLKLVQFLTSESKDYLALICLGATTPTLDAEGPISDTAPVPALTPATITAALQSLTGPQMQRPPAYSAIQVDGVRAYAAARAGQALELAPRAVQIDDLRLLETLEPGRDYSSVQFEGQSFGFPPQLAPLTTLVVWASVGSGTYLRSLARDLAQQLGTIGFLGGLVRLRVGQFALQQASSLADLASATPVPDLSALNLPQWSVDSIQAKQIRDGKRIATDQHGLLAVVYNDKLLAIAEADGQLLKVRRGFGGS